jgi:signal transduction histidine kinase
MPLPALIAALRANPEPDGMRATPNREPAEALGRVAVWLGLDGIRLELTGSGPLRRQEIGWGSLATDPDRPADFELSLDDGSPIGLLWADGERSASDEAAVAVEAAVLAARAHLVAEGAREHLAALDAALRGMSGALEVDAVLQLIVDRVRSLVDARYAALGIMGQNGQIEQFLTSGISEEQRRAIGAPPQGRGLLGLLVREGRSLRIPDIGLDPRRHGFPPNHPPMSSFLGVPITIRGRAVGNLYLTDKVGHDEFSAADQELVERFALHAGVAIEQARLAAQVQQLLLIEERERIGADLHDGVIQRIYGVNLSLDEVPELVASQPDVAAHRVEQAIEALNATIAEIREFIYILRPPGDRAGLGASLHALASEVHLQTGLSVEVEADDLPVLGGDRMRDVLAIVREALSNAARHASASRATVAVRPEDHGLRIEIADDGIGFDAAVEHDEGHHGLVNMRRRAERLGGTLEVVSRPGAGTRIIVLLPTEGERMAGGGNGRA